jgi:YpzG-like protein
MGSNQKKRFYDNLYSNPFNQPWANPKHAQSQVNGETQQTQNLIILEAQTRKRS